MNSLPNTYFIQLLQIAVGQRHAFDSCPSDSDWTLLYHNSIRHTLTGVLYAAIEKLPAEQRPPRNLKLKWFAITERIKIKNQQLNREVVKVVAQLKTLGWDCVLLKGQGLSTCYTEPLLRMPGDIDLWVKPTNTTGNQLQSIRKKLAETVSLFGKVKGVTYCHMRINLLKQTDVELHVTPSWLCCPWLNHKVQAFFTRHRDAQFEHLNSLPLETEKIAIPTVAFNRIYLLLHLFRHLYCSGFGLRQLMDYYLILKVAKSEDEKIHDRIILKNLKLERFAGGIMYVMQHIFGLSEEQLLCPINAKEGIFILHEVLRGGNMGYYDDRICWKIRQAGSIRNFVQSIFRNGHFIFHYPMETLYDPYFRARFFLVRKLNGWQ